MRPRDHVAVEYLLSAVTYDPETGIVRWKYREDMPTSWNGRFPGKVVGTTNESDYIFFMIKGRRIAAHRAAWAIMTGVWPKFEVDHWDTVKSNNSWGNLRDATAPQNRRNRGRNANNTSGYKGVTYCKLTGRWSATIGYDGTHHYLGRRDTPEAAFELYRAAAEIHHQDFVNLGEL